MPASVVAADLHMLFHVLEDLGVAPSGLGDQSPFEDFDQLFRLDENSPTTPKRLVAYKTALSAGNYDIDLTSAQSRNGTVNCSGMRLLALAVFNPAASTSAITIDAGPSNGYEINGTDPLSIGANDPLMRWFRSTSQTVDGTHKVIRVAAIGDATPLVALLFG